MSVVKAIFSNFFAFLVSALMILTPYNGIKLPVIKTVSEDCLLNVQLLSDTHLESKEPFRKLFLKSALKNMTRSGSKIDAVLIAGDITNYADDASLAAYYDIIKKYSPAPVITAAGNHDIGHAGDRNKTEMTREEARDNFIKYRNEYMGRSDTVNYFSTEINGYRFIILGDEVIDGGHWDAVSMSEEQLAFLDNELKKGTKDGKPVFVCSHWPMCNINGEDTIWPESGIDRSEYDIISIMEKYNNVFYISGHMHSGIKPTIIEKWFGLSNVEQLNGVTYINLPTFGLVNMFGNPVSGTGAQLEVYKDKVLIRPRNMLTNNWFENAEYTIDLK